MAGVEAELGALAEREQPARQRRFAIDPDQRLGADQVARRPEQRMAALDGAHLDPVDRPIDAASDLRLDELDAVAVGAKALVADDQRQRDRVDAEDQRPFLGDDVEQRVDARRPRSRRAPRSWIEATAPEWPRAKAIRSWLASSTAPSRSRRCATARSSKGITVAIATRGYAGERLISY